MSIIVFWCFCYYKFDKFDKNDLFKACENNEIIKVNKLLHYGIDINSKTDSGNTALYISTKLKNKLLVEYLIEQGADINYQNNKGMTALHIAALYGFVDIVILLIKNNANTNLECNKKLIPLNYALMSRTESHTFITQLLINKT